MALTFDTNQILGVKAEYVVVVVSHIGHRRYLKSYGVDHNGDNATLLTLTLKEAQRFDRDTAFRVRAALENKFELSKVVVGFVGKGYFEYVERNYADGVGR